MIARDLFPERSRASYDDEEPRTWYQGAGLFCPCERVATGRRQFPLEEDGEEPPTEDDIYRELADGWFVSEFPELAHACSPHRIALLAAHIRDFYTSDFALVVLSLVPDLAAWLTERSGLSAEVGGRTRAYAAGTAVPDVDPHYRAHSLLTPIRE